MDLAIQVQIVDVSICILHSLGKGKNPTRLGDLIFVWQPVKDKENFGFKPVNTLHLKIDLVSLSWGDDKYIDGCI